MEKKSSPKNDSQPTIRAALISGVFTTIAACISGIFGILSALPEVQRLSIPTEVVTFITIVLSIIVVSVILIFLITSYIRNQTRLANSVIVKLVEKEKDLFQEIENETTSLIAEKV